MTHSQDFLTKPISKDRLLGVVNYFASKNKKQTNGISNSNLAFTLSQDKDPSTISMPEAERNIDNFQSLNKMTIDRLNKDVGGNIDRPIRRFLKNLPRRISDISDAISNQAPGQLETTAHKLKGSAATVGAEQLASMCRQLEVMGKNGNFPENQKFMNDLAEEVLIIKKALADYLIETKQS
jgi:two-component system, sensor histidine kinase and response regulator